ncbi:MAG TPA: TonB-dependent receptor [Saprospiraceae bacterium]|nr:TonB-dependent receptor [Saprospiraceae bacterium]
MSPVFTRFLFVLSLMTTLSALHAQSTIKGVLNNGETGEPLPYATLILHDSADSSMVANALTEADGAFTMQAPAGDYYLLCKYVGFEDKIIPNITISASDKTKNLEEINLMTGAVDIETMEVKADRSKMEMKLDRRVFNVGKDLTNAGNNAADILNRVPSVNVDPEGNVSLRGSGSVRILVNGKPSGLLSAGDTEALLRMQGDIIESIEVITNPSARYEAEGEAGIINIILKKNQEKGVNGSFGATVGSPTNYGASYNLNYRQQDLNFFSNFGVDYRRTPGGGNSTQRFFDNAGNLTNFFTSEEDQMRGGVGGYFQGGLDWNIDEKNLLTTSLLYRLGEDRNEGTVTYRDFNTDSQLTNTTIRDIVENQTDHNLEASLDYKRTFDEEDREWTFSFKYILSDDTEIADIVQSSDDSMDDLLQNSRNTEDEENILIQTDYIHPIGENSKLEAGLRAALRTVDNDFLVQEEQADGSLETLGNFDDYLRYTEDIYAAYVIGAHEAGPLGIQLGLRAEYSDITAALLRSNNSNDQNYLSFFPSAAFTYKVTEENQLQVSYSRRLSRPFFRRLLPFSNFNDPRSNGIGNPNLRPEFTNSFETGFLKYFTNGSLLTSVYYRHTTGVIEELILPSNDGTSIEYPVNLSDRDAYGLEMSFNYDLTEWWNVTSDLNFFRAQVNGSFEGVDYSADIFSWTGGLITQFDPTETLQLQASFDYNAPQNTTQGRRLAVYSLDLAASLDILQGKGTITISGRDLFNTRIRRSVIDLPNYKAESAFQWRQTRQLVATFSYRLNQDR